jgi:hypothetical protein
MTNAVDIAVRAIDDMKSSTGLFKLPGGYLDEKGILHDEIQIREMTGAEEDILAGKTDSITLKLNAIMAGCLVRIGSITDPGEIAKVINLLPSGDRIYLLVLIRMVTLGDDFAFDEKCPECGDKATYNIFLSSLEVTPMKDKNKREFEFTAPSGKKIIIKTLLGKDEGLASKYGEEYPNDVVSAIMLARVVSIDGVPATVESLKKLGWKDRSFARKSIESIDGGVELGVTNECKKCNFEFTKDLQIGSQSFFFPSETLNS